LFTRKAVTLEGSGGATALESRRAECFAIWLKYYAKGNCMTKLIDNRAFRVRTMKEIIRHLHQGGDPQEVRKRLKELVRQTDASEIAAMEQALITEGMSVEEGRSK
jgi:hypothetical protein